MPMGVIMVLGIMAQSITVIATKNIIGTESMVGIIDRKSTTVDITDMVIIHIGIIIDHILILVGISVISVMDIGAMDASKVSSNVVIK